MSRCLAGRDFHLTVCTEPHTHRATGAIRIPRYAFPSKKERRIDGIDRCRPRTSSRTYRYGWPSKVAWEAGDHALVCYTRTRR